MHRTVLSAAVGVLLLTVTACTSDSGATEAAPPSAGATPTAAATVAAEPTPTATIDYTANTKKICARVDRRLAGKEMDRFAEDLGQMITYRKAKQTAKARTARTEAQRDLTALATGLRQDTASARDPKLKAAGQKAAAEVKKSSTDTAFFTRIRTVKDIRTSLTTEMTPWLTPLSVYCD
jgi:hypothetical protein